MNNQTKNIWVDVDQFYEQNLSPELVQEMNDLGREVYEMGESPRVLHKDDLGKVINDEFQILENNKNGMFRLRVKDNFYDQLLLNSMSSILWSIGLLILGLGCGTFIEHLIGIDISYSILLLTVMYCLLKHGVINLIGYSIASGKYHFFYGALILIGVNILLAKEIYHNIITIQRNNEPLSFLYFIQDLLSFLPILIHFLWYSDFLNYILIKNNIRTNKLCISVDDFLKLGPLSFRKLNNQVDFEKWEEEYNQYFDKIKAEEKEIFIKQSHLFYSFKLINEYNNMFVLVFPKKINLDGIYQEIQNNNHANIPNHLLGPIQPITYSRNKNFIHIGELPVDEEKLIELIKN